MTAKRTTFVLGTAVLLCSATAGQSSTPSPESPSYTADGQLVIPQQYREWVYLTSGFDMSYSLLGSLGPHRFDNVFVNPGAYQTFVKTGTWPSGTTMILEVRTAMDKGSINTGGHYQGTGVLGIEVHVKDESRFSDKWAFFSSDGKAPAKMVAKSADCYSCHAAHAAVDTTFVQFYPTLLPIARSKGTFKLSPP